MGRNRTAQVTKHWSWRRINRSYPALHSVLVENCWPPALQTRHPVFGVPRTGQRRTSCKGTMPVSQMLHGIHSSHAWLRRQMICVQDCGMLKPASVCESCEDTAISCTAASSIRMVTSWYGLYACFHVHFLIQLFLWASWQQVDRSVPISHDL